MVEIIIDKVSKICIGLKLKAIVNYHFVNGLFSTFISFPLLNALADAFENDIYTTVNCFHVRFPKNGVKWVLIHGFSKGTTECYRSGVKPELEWK